MNILIVFANPNPNSLTASFTKHITEFATQRGHSVTTRDLYELNFSPILGRQDFNKLLDGQLPADIQVEHEYIKKADLLLYLYPIWWAGPPALFKGYIDRVFIKGFAYQKHADGTFTKGLTDKKAIIINTMGANTDVYEKTGMLKSMNMPIDTGVMDFCGVDVLDHIYFGNTEKLNIDLYNEFIQTLDEKLNTYL